MNCSHEESYVVVFIITPDRTKVLLLKKQRPAAHKGCWNGLGGRIEAGETPLQCLRREVHEEAGITLTNCGLLWNGLADDGRWLYVYTSVYYGAEDDVRKGDAGRPEWHPTAALPAPLVPDVEEIIQAALKLRKNRFTVFADIT